MRKATNFFSLLLIFILPWEDSISVGSIGSLARLIGFIAAGFWIATIVLEGKFRKPSLFHSLVLFFFLWNFVSLFWSLDIENTITRIKTYSQIFLLILLYWDVFQTPEKLRAGLQAYVLGAYVLVFSIIYNYLAGNVAVEYEGRFSATGVNANDVVLILIICLPIALQLLFDTPKTLLGNLLQTIDFLYIPLSIFSCILTGSRTSLVVIIPFVVFITVTRRIGVERKLLVFAVLAISFLALFPFIPTTLIDRLGTIGDSISGADLGGRVVMWKKSILMLGRYPFFGVGSGAIDATIGGAVHNTLLSVAGETGFIGLMLFVFILGLVVYKATRMPEYKSAMWLVVFATWMLGAVSLSWEFRKITWIILSFVMIESNFTISILEQAQRRDSSGSKGRVIKLT